MYTFLKYTIIFFFYRSENRKPLRRIEGKVPLLSRAEFVTFYSQMHSLSLTKILNAIDEREAKKAEYYFY